MRRWSVGTALIAVLMVVRTGAAQDGESPVERLDALEKKLAEQARRLEDQQKEIERLKLVPRAAPKEETEGGKSSFGIFYDQGVEVRGTVNGQKVVIRPRGRLQLDYRCFPQNQDNSPNDQFQVQRARVGFSGRFAMFSFNLQVDPMRDPNLPLGDFWFQWDQFDELQVQLGHVCSPFALGDGMTDNIYYDMIQAPMVIGGGNVLCPDFRPGVTFKGGLRDGILKYWVSVQSQTDRNVQLTDELTYSARLQSSFAGVLIGASGRWDRRDRAQPSFPGVTPGGFQFFTPVNVNGWTQGYAGDVSYVWGPAWVSFEYAWASQERRRVLADRRDGTSLITQGGYLTVGWMFWGPKKGHPQLPTPFADWHLFSPDIERRMFSRNVGAELVCRLEWCDLDDARDGRTFVSGVPATRSTAANAAKVKGNDAKAVTVGLNVWVIENVRFSFNYVHLRFGDDDRSEHIGRHSADEFLMRAQLEF